MSFPCNGFPNLFQIFSKQYLFTIWLLYSGISGIDFQCWTEACEDRIGTNNTFGSKSGHPFMDTDWKFVEHISPVANIISAEQNRRSSHGDGKRGGLMRRELLIPIADTRDPISVSIGHEPVIIQPASIMRLKLCFPAASGFISKNYNANPIWV